ncbi:hypothetical protein G4B88_004032 [Cannabis sativa]|uniref:Uncharacterized protein n=1 Tax=Cannabis sativa TaxID=3483 RepID=A0A7J6GXY2_CANSA|nr:hypothetical protein G4B88_004032 [Cannabis sativa]
MRMGQVFLYKDYNAKLCSFYAPIPIPEGETHVDTLKGTWGQILWDINSTKSQMNDGSSNYDWNGKLKHELETNALVEEEEEEDEEIRGQIMEYAKLVERCTNESVEERPNMVDVAKDHILIKTNNTL